MTIEEMIAAAIAAQLAPIRSSIDRMSAEFEGLRRSLPPQLLTPAAAAKVLCVSVSTIRRRIKDGTIPVDRSSGQPRIDASALRPSSEAEIERRVFELRQGGRSNDET